MKKIYISGKISGLPIEEVKQKFSNAETHLKSKGWDPVNPLNNGLPENSTWEQHIGKDIELLLGCEAIALLDDWILSKGASLELVVAQHSKMEVYWMEDMV